MRSFAHTLVVVTLWIAATPSAAQVPDARPITLRDALRQALRANPEVRAAELARLGAAARSSAARGAYAPVPYVQGSHSFATVPTTSFQLDEDARFEENVTSFGAGITGLVPTGARYSVDLSTARTESDPDGLFQPLFESYHSTLAQVSITQPLLQDAWGAATEATDVADMEATAARAQSAATRNDVALLVAQAYWDLASAQEAERVARESLQLAEQQLEATRIRIRVGRLSPLDEIAAQATAAERRDALVLAEQGRLDQQLAFMMAIGADRSSRQRPQPLSAAETPERPDAEQPLIVSDVEVQRALRSRADLVALRAQVRAAERHADALEQQALPDLSVTATAGLRGLAGQVDPDSERDPPPDFLIGGFGQSVSTTTRYPFVTLSARLEWPVPNTQASRLAAAARLDARARAEQLARAEWNTILQVRHAIDSLRVAQARFTTSEEALQLAERTLDAERRKFEAGISDIFEVSRRQEALAAARNARFGALARYHVARALLSHRRGTILRDLGGE